MWRGDHRYDVILMDAVPCDWPLEKVVRVIPGFLASRSRGAAILVLAEPDQVDVARALRSRGVNRVMLVTDPPEIICDQMANLLEVAPRVQIRLATNVEAALGTAGRELFCQTVNLSCDRYVDQDPEPSAARNASCLQDPPLGRSWNHFWPGRDRPSRNHGSGRG